MNTFIEENLMKRKRKQKIRQEPEFHSSQKVLLTTQEIFVIGLYLNNLKLDNDIYEERSSNRSKLSMINENSYKSNILKIQSFLNLSFLEILL